MLSFLKLSVEMAASKIAGVAGIHLVITAPALAVRGLSGVEVGTVTTVKSAEGALRNNDRGLFNFVYFLVYHDSSPQILFLNSKAP